MCNKLSLCHCGAGVRWTPLRSRSTDRAGRRDRRKVRGNPFSFKGNADSFVLRTQNDKSFSCHEYRVVCAISCRSVIAVRVSGGHLCEAEAPTEPAGETAVRCAAIRSLLKGMRILSCSALRMTSLLVATNTMWCVQ